MERRREQVDFELEALYCLFSRILVRGEHIDRIFEDVQLLEERVDGGGGVSGSNHHDSFEVRGV